MMTFPNACVCLRISVTRSWVRPRDLERLYLEFEVEKKPGRGLPALFPAKRLLGRQDQVIEGTMAPSLLDPATEHPPGFVQFVYGVLVRTVAHVFLRVSVVDGTYGVPLLMVSMALFLSAGFVP